ncbi:PAP2-domain-containing protein [Lentinus tigrinus ALCF2SS1-7]|uniref:PAP2-domain-containing protein n=1 Tax=Lentinus tigrinus ALCF2SS1-6 TaxID=1328759 RepID=A0A5C2SCU3_9APHY|nr:PAP2-domain-containing protein [Lentinus tigrinus ALCF2SS1-6]RPD76115.1 PAP2-domain-containing protein [Lentinus tigrinus ALCF2SS1-7]
MAHDEGRQTGLPWWLYALDKTNAIVTTLTGCFVLYTGSAGAAYFATGAVLCSVTVKILKRFVRQPRPVIVNGRRKKTYGMPSTHSAVITYFATYISLACLYLPMHPSLPASRVLPVFLALPLATTIAVSRIWLGHHTWPQVGAGCVYGLLFAPLWFKLWTGGLNEYGPVVEDMVRSYVSFYT